MVSTYPFDPEHVYLFSKFLQITFAGWFIYHQYNLMIAEDAQSYANYKKEANRDKEYREVGSGCYAVYSQ